ncbi:hypothetical protein FVER53263_12893 [Fusarium verticillioides]|nr:hypothetical protein FVER53263_12893 [Fusarium verticillioides]RBR05546.1 hypothetical protein FVER53590_12893 [Fusarium verticillioides]
MATMKAIGVSKYGPIDNLESRDVPKPSDPTGRQVVVKVKACSVNPIDHKVRSGTYDDAPDYYNHVPRDFHIIGFDGSGVVEKTGPDCQLFKVGDEVSWVGPSTDQGSYAEYQLISELACAKKPRNLDFVDTASFGLTFMTAYQSLYRRMEVKPEEQTGILIINGGGGVGSAAIQLARRVLKLPVVVATASRPETIESCKRMGATHVINHREDLAKQIDDLRLNVPIKEAPPSTQAYHSLTDTDTSTLSPEPSNTPNPSPKSAPHSAKSAPSSKQT